jgi:metal-responsive CopG/Arc/MetJ family transcriptional regulator
MKVKTSITLSEDVLNEIKRIFPDSVSRSTFIEKAIRNFLIQKRRELQEKKDMEIINQVSVRLNKEASDVLSYQMEL